MTPIVISEAFVSNGSDFEIGPIFKWVQLLDRIHLCLNVSNIYLYRLQFLFVYKSCWIHLSDPFIVDTSRGLIFVNKNHKQITFENGSNLCVRSILAHGPETQLKLKLKHKTHIKSFNFKSTKIDRLSSDINCMCQSEE